MIDEHPELWTRIQFSPPGLSRLSRLDVSPVSLPDSVLFGEETWHSAFLLGSITLHTQDVLSNVLMLQVARTGEIILRKSAQKGNVEAQMMLVCLFLTLPIARPLHSHSYSFPCLSLRLVIYSLAPARTLLILRSCRCRR